MEPANLAVQDKWLWVKPMLPFWGRCTTHFRTHFSGDWGTIWLLTHGQIQNALNLFSHDLKPLAASLICSTLACAINADSLPNERKRNRRKAHPCLTDLPDLAVSLSNSPGSQVYLSVLAKPTLPGDKSVGHWPGARPQIAPCRRKPSFLVLPVSQSPGH